MPFSQDTTDKPPAEYHPHPHPEPEPNLDPSPGLCQLNWSCFKKVSCMQIMDFNSNFKY